MISPTKPLPIKVTDPDAPLPQEAIRAIAAILLDAVDAEDRLVRASREAERDRDRLMAMLQDGQEKQEGPSR